jgi:hypothetical protein
MKSPKRIFKVNDSISRLFLIPIIVILISKSISKMPCMYYFDQLELLYDMQTFKNVSDDNKMINGNFYLNKTNEKLPGQYLINLCEDLEIEKICEPQESSIKIQSKGSF